jgi:hypothetical protein
MGSRFTCSIPYLPYPPLYRPAVGLRFCCLGEGRTYVSKLEKGASYPGLEIIAHLAIVCRRVESHRAPIGVAIRGNLRRPMKC